MRLIDADALKEAIEQIAQDYVDDNFFWTKLFNLIDNAPTVDIKDEIAGAYNEGYMCGNKEAEKARPQGKWIPVSERLPEKEGFYLVFLENEQMVVAHSSGIIANHDFEPKMLAWQPLPEPYKKGGAWHDVSKRLQ